MCKCGCQGKPIEEKATLTIQQAIHKMMEEETDTMED